MECKVSNFNIHPISIFIQFYFTANFVAHIQLQIDIQAMQLDNA